SRALVSELNLLVAGLKISGTSARQVRQLCAPEVTSMRPSGSAVTVGYPRRNAMFGSDDQLWLTGSKMLALAAPRPDGSWPPATRMRPSGSCACPAQKRL